MVRCSPFDCSEEMKCDEMKNEYVTESENLLSYIR